MEGDILVLGVGGKMGPTLARMAKRAAPGKRVIGVARFSEPSLKATLESQGVECIASDLLDREAIGRLPNVGDGVRNVVFMAGHKFGAADNASLTWMMNVGVPLMVAEAFREARIVAFSTACVYPFVPVDGPGASEDVPATPPSGDYANSCVGRERMFEYASRKYGTPGRLVRLSYAIDTRYGVLHDVATAVYGGVTLDLAMGHADVIWQGDANEQSLRLLAHCTTPTSPINITGTLAHQHPLARRGIRPAAGQEAAVHRLRGADCLARGHDAIAASLRQARRAAGADDRLGGGLGEQRPAQPRQADSLLHPRWQVLSLRVPSPILPSAC